MDKENVIETPNEVKQMIAEPASRPEVPHLTELELAQIRVMQQTQAKKQQAAEFNWFCKQVEKPKKQVRDLTVNEEGKVIRRETPVSAPVDRGNVRKGTLRNKKCSCGSGLKYKMCCLRTKHGES